MYRLPFYYNDIPEFDELQKNLGDNSDYFLELQERLSQELYVPTAKGEGLEIWSKILLSSKDTKDILTRLRGTRTITKLNLALIVKEILGSDTKVEVTEKNDLYRVYLGVHTELNRNDLQEFLRGVLKLVIPSHIELFLYFNALLWLKFDNYDKTWDSWDRLDLTWERFEKYNEDTGGI